MSQHRRLELPSFPSNSGNGNNQGNGNIGNGSGVGVGSGGGTVPPPTTQCLPSPVPAPSDIPTLAPPPAPSLAPTQAPTLAPTPTPPPPLTGIWIWKGFASGQGSATMQGNLPNVALLNALNGTVQITTNSFAASVQISGNTCPPSFNVHADNGGLVSISVNNSVMNCQFTVTDPGTGSMTTVNFSNTST